MSARAPSEPIRPKHVVILCHPEATSFNAAVARTYCEEVEACGHETVLRDLYRMGFDPVLRASERPTVADFSISRDVEAELDIIADATVIALIYPIWFGTPPAMLKGYVERVLGAAFSYRAMQRSDTNPLLAGKQLVSITSSGTTRAWQEEHGAWLALREVFDHYLRDAFSFVSDDHLHLSSITEGLAERYVLESLFEVRERARLVCSGIKRARPAHRTVEH